MKKLILSAVLTLSALPLFSQAFIISAGYTSANIRYHDLEFLGDSVAMKNGGQELDIPQKTKGFNVGLGLHGGGNGMYIRMAGNFSKHGMKSFSLADGSTLRIRSTATDAYVAFGGFFGGNSGGALYLLGGGTLTTGRIDLNEGWNELQGAYRGHQIKFTYGFGFGLILESGFGLTCDFLCNFSQRAPKGFMKDGDRKIPTHYSTYLANPTNYNGDYVRPSTGYFRGQVTLHIPLGG